MKMDPSRKNWQFPPLDSMFPYEKMSFRLGISHGIAMFDEGYFFSKDANEHLCQGMTTAQKHHRFTMAHFRD